MSEHARNTLSSFLPEPWLVRMRHTDALWMKYRYTRASGVMARLAGLIARHPGESRFPDDISILEDSKTIGALTVNANQEVPAGGRSLDRKHHIRMEDRNTIQLHLSGARILTGREDLTRATDYIRGHDALRNTPYVVGVTYQELAALLIAQGFSAIEISELDPEYQLHIRAEHQVFCALNGITGRDARSAMVFMPTADFVETFSRPPEAP